MVQSGAVMPPVWRIRKSIEKTWECRTERPGLNAQFDVYALSSKSGTRRACVGFSYTYRGISACREHEVDRDHATAITLHAIWDSLSPIMLFICADALVWADASIMQTTRLLDLATLERLKWS